VLTKPVTPSTLLEAIGETLHKGVEITTRSEERQEHHSDAMASLQGARVLLVEDNDMNQELAMELLGNAGITVTLAVNGQEALDKINAQPLGFDGVLMDCQMPVMDGYAATREIRKNPAFKDLPILAMTANAMAGDREKVIDAGMNDHIAKPLNVAAMFATMAKWITPHASSSTAPQGSADAMTSIVDTADSTGARGQKGINIDSALADDLQRLKGLLEDNDAEAADAVDALQAMAAGTPLAATLKRVATAVSAFDFDAALAALAQGDF
jgi:CheY-like chemotaxis protein